MSEPELTKEERILRMMRRTLTDVARDTACEPGIKHPLSEKTIMGIRECLVLIAAREQELAEEHGRDTSARPRYRDQPRDEVVVPLDVASLRRKDDEGSD
ncbi:MAG TPA: segregation and condensation protein A [Gammaproteobacteria bacterium]|nr:segregation and condensation protein A [Gammaproteobacteria bacterium]